MAASSIRDVYLEMLLDRVREESYPNPDHMDRIEGLAQSPEQVMSYLEVLFSKLEGTRYPSSAILDRIERYAVLT